jgi:histidine phosphotransferase ChpT
MRNSDGLELAQALCARLCHDLGGAVGSLVTVMDLGPAGGDEAGDIARESAEILRRRLRLFRLLAGAAEHLSREGLETCVEGMLSHGKVVLAGGVAVSAPAVPAVLAAILLASEALPRGGAVVLAGDPAKELMIIPTGPGAAWPPALAALLAPDGVAPEPTPRTVFAHVLSAAAEQAGLALRLALGAGQGGAALLMTRRRAC